MKIKKISLQEERASGLGIDVILLKISSVLGTGAVKTGKTKEIKCQNIME